MLSAAIFFHDNHGVFVLVPLIGHSYFLSVEMVQTAGEADEHEG